MSDPHPDRRDSPLSPALPAGVLLLLGTVLLGLTTCDSYEEHLDGAVRGVARALEEHGTERVVVADFHTADGRITELGRLLSREVAGELASLAETFEVCDRERLGDLLQEHRLGTTGLLAEEQVQELGHFCGADGVVVGHVTPREDVVEIQVRVLDASTAVVLGAEEAAIPLTASTRNLLGRELAAVAGVEPERRDVAGGPSRERNGESVREAGSDRGPVGAAAQLSSEPETGGKGSSSASPTTTTRRNLPQRATVGPFDLKLETCRFEQYRLRCELEVRNDHPAPQHLYIRARSRLLDTDGYAYYPVRGNIAGASRDFRVAIDSVDDEVPPNATVRVELVFTDVDRRKKKAQLLEVVLDLTMKRARFEDFFFDRDELDD